jgi:membrane protein DedA with SNARE-associated domain
MMRGFSFAMSQGSADLTEDQMADWILNLIRGGSYPALALLTVVENVFPPIPSELILPLAGYLSRHGDLVIWWAIVAATAGSLIGSLPLYYLGRRMGRNRVREWVEKKGRWVAVTPDELERAQKWFEGHDGRSVFVGRLIPGLRSLVSIPAGTSKMPLGKFLTFTFAGSLIWSAALCLAGYALGAGYEMVDKVLDPIAWIVIGGSLAMYLYRVIKGTGGGKKR